MDKTDTNVKQEFVLKNKFGMHARTAAVFVRTAAGFSCDINVRKDDVSANGKSIMDLMVLGAGPGSTLTVEIAGNDAVAAMKAIEELFNKTFLEIM